MVYCSTKITIDNKLCDELKINGQKEWDCSILIRDTVEDHTVIHEMLHAYSISHENESAYIMCRPMEEATVELLTREICLKKKIPFGIAYEDYVTVLREINSVMKFAKTDYDFAVELFNLRPQDRYSWLHDKVSEFLIKNNVSIGDSNDIMKFIEILEDIKI